MLNRAREWWERLGRTNQLTLVLTSVGVLIALIGFVVWAGTPEYAPLFNNLSAQDANAITEKLRESNVPYRLSQSGTAVEVPAQQVDEMHMKLIGLINQSPSAGMSSEDPLKQNTMTMTSEMEQLAMRRSLEERVSRSIMTMDPIASANVIYAAADASPLLMSNHDSSAAVVVTCKPGRSLSDDNVHAIVRLTQMAYTGLQEKNITVSNSAGDTLWDGQRSSGIEGGDRYKREREMEIATRTDVQTMLDRTIGPHKSIAVAHVELNGDDKQEHKVIADAGTVVSKTSENEDLNGQGTTGSNATVGALGNVNGAPAPAAGAPGTPTYQATTKDPGSHYTHENKQITYQPSTTDTVTHTGQGKIEKMTVSVLLDSNQYKDNPTALAATQATIKQIVETNIGVDPADTAHTRLVSVAAVPFDRSQEIQEAQIGEQQHRAELIRQLAGLLVPFLIMSAALFLLARALRKPRLAELEATPATGALSGYNGSQLLLDAEGVPLPGQTDAGEALDDSPLGLPTGSGAPRTFEVIEEAFDANLESILHLARTKPDMVSLLVKNWVSDD